MNVSELNMIEVEERLAALETEVREMTDIDAVNAAIDEKRTLLERKAELAEIEQRKLDADALAAGTAMADKAEEIVKEKREMSYEINTVEYRNAWLKSMQGHQLEGEELRAFTASNGAIATMTANSIMDVVRDHAPLLENMTVVYSAASINYYVENANADAVSHTDNAAITAANDSLSKISLTPAEIVKLIQVSEAAKQMSVDAFESWLAKALGEAIARKLNALTVTAIAAAATSAGTSVTSANVQALLGGCKGEKVAVVCSRKTLYTKLLPLQDNSKNALVRFEGAAATVYGVPVLLDDNVADGTVLAGDLTRAIAAMGESVTVRSAYDIGTNSYKYLGVALFDVKIGQASAFGKIVEA